VDFSRIAKEYEGNSLVQRSASDILLDLIKINPDDDVLDLGCGTGSLTRKIRELTKGRVVGIDPSEGMIKEAVRQSKGLEIVYERIPAEEIDYREEFTLIVSNSSLQWFRNPEKAIKNCYRALREGGRIGLQAPAGRVYSPNFIRAVKEVERDRRTRDTFSRFKEPWFLLESADEYRDLFERSGFRVSYSEIKKVITEYTPEEVFRIFMSGAAAGYLNGDYYDVELSEEYISAFKEIVLNSFIKQAGPSGILRLEFQRLFLIAHK